MVAIQFHNHALRQIAEGGRGAHSGGQYDSPPAVISAASTTATSTGPRKP